MLCDRYNPSFPLRSCSWVADANVIMRHKKAFQNLQLTEHHIDSFKQSAAGAGGDERRERGSGTSQLSSAGSSAMLRHRPPYHSGSHHWADGLLLSVRAAQLPKASCLRSAVIYVQRTLLGGSRRWNGSVLSSTCS